MLSWTPSHAALEELCHRIGNATFQLGIELELDIVTLQSIEKNHMLMHGKEHIWNGGDAW